VHGRRGAGREEVRMLAAGSIDLSWIHHLNWVDYLFLVIAVYSVLTGAWVGFMAECITIGGILIGTIVAGQVYQGFGHFLGHAHVPKDAQDWAGFVAAFTIIFVIMSVGAILARKLSRIMVRDTVNKLAGAVIGLLSGAMLCLFIVVAVAYFHIGKMYTPLIQAQLPMKTTGWLTEFVTLLPNKFQHIPPLI
jgi:uncharacterized membrane protein required for colicin V production